MYGRSRTVNDLEWMAAGVVSPFRRGITAACDPGPPGAATSGGLAQRGPRRGRLARMIAVTDVYYPDGALHADAGCALIASWTEPGAVETRVVRVVGAPAPYQPGQFFSRELPALRAVLAAVASPIEIVVVDGYVWLDGARPGLGAHLHRALDGRTPVVGVAKSRFAGAPAIELLRGGSRAPLLITAAGVEPAIAAGWVASMHGPHRMPTILTLADHLSRGLTPPRGVAS